MEEEATGKGREEKTPRNDEEPGGRVEMREPTGESSLCLRVSEEGNAYGQLYMFTGFCCGGDLCPVIPLMFHFLFW